MIVVDNPGSDDGAYWPIMHAKWNGWTPADFIFPSSLFLVGMSLVYSFEARRQRGETNKQILLHVFRRSLILIVRATRDSLREADQTFSASRLIIGSVSVSKTSCSKVSSTDIDCVGRSATTGLSSMPRASYTGARHSDRTRAPG